MTKEEIKEYKHNWYLSNKGKAKEYRLNNKELLKTKAKLYRKDNPNKLKDWRKNNADHVKQYKKEYRQNNKVRRNEVERLRKTTDVIYKLKCNIQRTICDTLRGKNYTKKSRTHEILGCSFDEFKTYLESKFEPWMSWGNHGLYNGVTMYGWDVDHIIPLASAKTEQDVIRLNHYTNLQPLCSYINRDIKKDEITSTLV